MEAKKLIEQVLGEANPFLRDLQNDRDDFFNSMFIEASAFVSLVKAARRSAEPERLVGKLHSDFVRLRLFVDALSKFYGVS